MKRTLVALCGLFAGASIAGSTLDEPIFGLDLGKPWQRTLPPCPHYGVIQDYCAFGSAAAGLQLLKRPSRGEQHRIPSWVKETMFVRTTPDGHLASIAVNTPGPDAQDRVIESVTSRFGPPTKLEPREAKNAYGASWIVTRVTWDLPDVKITFDCYRRDECSLRFATPVEAAAEIERAKAAREKDKM